MQYYDYNPTSGDLKDNLTFMFRDPEWKKKILIGAGVNMIPILNFVNGGYMLAVIQNLRNGIRPPLPAWSDFGKFFMDGLKMIAISLIYAIPMILLSIIMSAASGASYNYGSNALAAGSIGLAIISLIYSLLLVFWIQGGYVNYAIKGTFASAFEFGAIWKIVQRGWKRMLATVAIYFVGVLVLGIVGAILVLIPCLGWVAIWLLVFGGIFYLILVMAYNIGMIALQEGPGTGPAVTNTVPPPPPGASNLGGWEQM